MFRGASAYTDLHWFNPSHLRRASSIASSPESICDMVAVARLLNLTLVVPELDKTSFWADPSGFEDIFDVRHFIDSLRDEVRIFRRLPKRYSTKSGYQMFQMPPVSWSDDNYYLNQLAPCDLTKKKKKTFVVQDAIEDSAESHGRHTIRCLIVQEEFIGYIAEHPNDEEEVEGIDLHQQRYPWEGSDMDYLYDEVSISLDGLRSIFESRRL
ncbi:hypothetical protein DY000_02045232 [Brassica cretica]|uniref:O-fucosyltransferase family protein n=1 Tax=Brassica cretica TaxID=69181 RepID=A0ABQ7EPK5_BRACR|nr:hypothetical protein DY000_02045232 [Brassica cretica]